MTGCAREKYSMDYGGQKSSFRGAKDVYRAGQKVRLYYDQVGTDTDYTFFLDGENLNCLYSARKGYIIRFEMPPHDATLGCVAHSSMVRSGFAEETSEPETVTSETRSAETSSATQAAETAVPTTAAPTTAASTVLSVPAGDCIFSAQYIRTDGYRDGEVYPKFRCITSKTALDDYCADNARLYHFDTAFSDAVRALDDDWFSVHELLLVVLEEGSGSVRHTVTRVEKTGSHTGTVTIERQTPQVGTADMAQWHILIGLDKDTFAPSDDVHVLLTNG